MSYSNIDNIYNSKLLFDNFVFFCSPPHSLLEDFTVSEGHGYPLVLKRLYTHQQCKCKMFEHVSVMIYTYTRDLHAVFTTIATYMHNIGKYLCKVGKHVSMKTSHEQTTQHM